jgi:penicillin-binding protein 1A
MNYGKRAAKHREQEIDAIGTKLRKKTGVFIGRAVLVAIVLCAVTGISAAVGVWKGIIDSAPDISAIDVVPTGYSTTVLDSQGNQIATLVASGANRKYVTIDEIPLNLQHAFVAIEDSRFYEHNGIDPKGIIRALVADIRTRSTSQGASTITQQLIKNSILENLWATEGSTIEKIQRKVQEQYLAVKLEQQVSKTWILEEYLNTINLGSNTLGVQAASERYFGKDVSELTLSECAVIAGITQNPYKYNPITFPEKNAERRESVLNAMKDQGYITQTEYDEAMSDPVYDRISEHNAIETGSVNSYYTDAVIEDVLDDLVNVLGWTETEAYKAIYQGGLEIHTAQDPDIQAICDEEANNQENYPSDPQYSCSLSFQVQKSDGTYRTYTNQTMLSFYKNLTGNDEYDINYATEEDCVAAIEQYMQDVLEEGDSVLEDTVYYTITLQPQVAMTVIDQYTGEVKALVGGRGDKSGNRTWNRATDTLRQPGSTFKIIAAYAPALDSGGMTLASVQNDAPYTVGTKTYKNYDSTYRGYTNVRTAITNSINIVTVKTLEDIGVGLGYQYAESFGFSTLSDGDKNLGLCLGGLTNGVSNLELTAAYAAIANGGEYMEPKFYTTVYDHDGNVLLDRSFTQETHRVIKETTAWLLTSAMEDVMTSGTGTRAYFGADMAQAGKSGTTTGNRDALFAGFTPYYTLVVWGGFDDNSLQAKGQTNYPKTIWKAVMSRIHEDLEYKDFEQPSGIRTELVCKESGKLPISHVCEYDQRGSKVYSEFFAQDNVPESECDRHVTVNICSESGMVAGAFCPTDGIVSEIYVRAAVDKLTGLEDSSSTSESDYVITDEELSNVCNLHDENSLPTEEEPADEEPSTGTGNYIPEDEDSTPGTGNYIPEDESDGGDGIFMNGEEDGVEDEEDSGDADNEEPEEDEPEGTAEE